MNDKRAAWDWVPVSRKPTAKDQQARRLSRLAKSVEHLIRSALGVNGRPAKHQVFNVTVQAGAVT